MTDPDRLDKAAEESKATASANTPQQLAGPLTLLRNHRAWVVAALSLAALAGVLAVLIAVVGGGGVPQASSSSSRGPAAADASPGTTPAAAQASSGVSKASSGFPSAAQVAQRGGAIIVPAGMQNAVLAWQSGTGGTSLTAVTSLFGTALQQKGLRQYPLMKSTCTELANNVLTAQAGPPIPVAAMETVYVQALGELAQGAADCQTAIIVTNGDESLRTQVDTALLDRSAAELAAGSRDIFRSTAEIVIASRATP